MLYLVHGLQKKVNRQVLMPARSNPNMAGRHETYQISDTIAFDILGKPFKARWWD